MHRLFLLALGVTLLFSCTAYPHRKEAAVLYPTPPVPIDDWPGKIDDATTAEKQLICAALAFAAARDKGLIWHYVRRVVVHANNFCDPDGKWHFDVDTVPDIAGHYHARDDGAWSERTICLWRGKIDLGLIWHEIDHGNTLFLLAVDERIPIENWKASAGGKYGIEYYPETQSFPHLRFLSRHGTRNDSEDRAEWRRYVYLLLWKLHREKLGFKEDFSNPIERLDPADIKEGMNRLHWLLSRGVITWDDFVALLHQPCFSKNRTP